MIFSQGQSVKSAYVNEESPTVIRPLQICSVALLSLCLLGCSNKSLEKSMNNSEQFDFIEFFEGHRRVSGWFSDPFGNVRRHFCGDFYGTVQADGSLELDETLNYSDGMQERRVWIVNVSDTGEFSATSDSLVGDAKGKITGNTLRFQYVMNVQIDPKTMWTLSMNDSMFLQADGSLHNITHVKKFGVRIGTVSTQYFKGNAVAKANMSEASDCNVHGETELRQVANL
jgi:hypothetical protein